MALHFYNTWSRSKEPFEAVATTPDGRPLVRMYNCGPTVYARQHVGNFRAFLFADTLRRWLEVRGFEVEQVMNITDVGHLVADADEGEDKIQVEAQKAGLDPWAISRRWADAFLADLAALGVRPAKRYPRATEFVSEMLEIVDGLVAKGFAYRAGEGGQDVYFDVTKFPAYGKLSGNRVDDLAAGARVEVREEKRHPADFALWKSDPAHVMKWPSRYGPHGYPGWHIECSAMARALLGDQLDIHTGGEDNVFPHHECEIAQSEAFTDKRFSRFWMHTRFLTVDGGKMSKSLGNVYTLDDVRERSSVRVLRYALIRGHYRSPLDFTWTVMEECQTALSKLDEMVSRLRHGDLQVAPSSGRAAVERARADFFAAMDDDLGTPEALAALFTLRSHVLQVEVTGEAAASALDFLHDVDRAFGLLRLVPPQPETAAGGGNAETALWRMGLGFISDEEVERRKAERNAAKAARDFARADRIRKELADAGIVLQDLPGGKTIWRRG